MNLGFIVNDIASEKLTYATTHLAFCAMQKGHTVYYAGVGDLARLDHSACDGDTLWVQERREGLGSRHALRRHRHRAERTAEDRWLLGFPARPTYPSHPRGIPRHHRCRVDFACAVFDLVNEIMRDIFTDRP